MMSKCQSTIDMFTDRDTHDKDCRPRPRHTQTASTIIMAPRMDTKPTRKTFRPCTSTNYYTNPQLNGAYHMGGAPPKKPGTATSCHPTGQLQEWPQRNLKYPTKTGQGAAIGAAALDLRRRRARQQRRNPSGRRMPASAFLVSRRVSKSRLLVAKRQRLRQYSIKRREPRMFSRRRTQTLAFHVRPRRSCASQSGPGRCDGRQHRPGTWGAPTRDAAPRQEVQARYRNSRWRDDARSR